MALVKLEIDGRRVMADGGQTILQVARQHGIQTIPTLCDDAQLEPAANAAGQRIVHGGRRKQSSRVFDTRRLPYAATLTADPARDLRAEH